MKRPPLEDVLGELLWSIIETGERTDPISGTALVVTSAEVELPLDGLLARDADGRPILLASPPIGNMKTGFDRPTHRAHIRLVAEEDT